MSVRSINGTYTLNEGTILPGFNETPKFLGLNNTWDAPGWKFVLGDQDPNIRFRAAENGWMTDSRYLTTPFQQVRSENLNIRANVEPSPDLKIQLDIRKETTTSYQENFRNDSIDDGIVGNSTELYRSFSPSRSGSYKISYLTIRTAFDRTNDDVVSNVFAEFERNLLIMQNRFFLANNELVKPEYDTTAQDVVIPAFLAAYSGADPNSISLSPFPKNPLPNWRIDYSGLNKIPALKNVFQSITISHAYQSFYSVVNYSNSLDFSEPSVVGIDRPVEDYNRTFFARSIDGRYTPAYIITQVLISETFAPLVGINVRTKGRLTAKAEYRTKRDLSLNISNAQVTELNSRDIVFELGWTKNNLKLPFKSQGRTIVLKNDVTFRTNVTISDSKTIQRKIDDINTITNGNLNVQIRPNISYVVNQKLTLQAYYERTVNEPQITNSFPRTTTRFGIQLRFSLAQ
jgi:cell surface protein SprA